MARLIRRAGLLALLVALVLTALAGPVLADAPSGSMAEEPGNRAGLVVRFADGSVQTACVDLGPSGQVTGEELLRLAGMDPVMDSRSALGGIVCQIGAEGCGFPEQSCWCQCKGDPCVYWRYFHQVEGQWVYATVGASTHIVQAGQVDGWAWGAGETEDGVKPPLLTWDDVCAQPAAASASTAETLYTPVPAEPATSSADAAPAVQRPLAAPVALAASDASPAASAPGSGDYVFFGAIFLMVVAGAAGLRLTGFGRVTRSHRVGQISLNALSGALIYVLSAGIGVLALLYPFFLTAVQTAGRESGRAGDSGLLLFVLMGLCFAALLSEVQGQAVSAKHIALLGVLVAINSVLRFVEVGIPGPGGFTPIFFLIVLTGYVYGGRFGFLMGALTMLASAVITGGVGPWLPGQMFTAGWVGLTAPLARPLVRLAGGAAGSRREIVLLAAFAGLWGLVYGVVINLWFWPFMAGPADQYYQAGLGLTDVIRRYAAFYLTTSLLWDVMAVLGNVALVLAFGGPTLRALRRFQQRFDFRYRPWTAQLKT